jgi:transcriptional regulator with XRE-family HTH domain
MAKKTSKIRIGQRIKALRKERKLSQEELAENIGKSVETISHIERSIFLPRLETAQEIADVLGVPLFELFAYDVSETDKAKAKATQEIIRLLHGQPLNLIKTTLDQVKSFISLKDSYLNKSKK